MIRSLRCWRPPVPRGGIAALLGALALAAALSGCGSKHDALGPTTAHPFSVELDYFPNADHAALYSALDHGDFRHAGLAVSLIPPAPNDPASPLQLLAAGKVDMAISYEPEVLLARDAGVQVVSIGALIQRPLTSVIAVGARHLTSVTQLKGKRVGTAGIPYQTAMLDTILQQAGVPASSVTQTNLGEQLVPAMVSGRVAATLGGFWNYEGIQLTQAGLHPTIIPVNDLGVPTYDELVLVVRVGEAKSEGELLREFIQAVSRGELEVRGNPAAAVGELAQAYPGIDRKLQLASIQATESATEPPLKSEPFGWQNPVQWQAFGAWMLAHGLLRHPAPVTDYDNEFLPGQSAPLTGSSSADSS
jgi:putative hydroxymethylpyrimidine transport system substrate-binding protein